MTWLTFLIKVVRCLIEIVRWVLIIVLTPLGILALFSIPMNFDNIIPASMILGFVLILIGTRPTKKICDTK